MAPVVVPVPKDLATRYPSTQWGITEWVEALQDNDLFYRILKGIARARAPRR